MNTQILKITKGHFYVYCNLNLRSYGPLFVLVSLMDYLIKKAAIGACRTADYISKLCGKQQGGNTLYSSRSKQKLYIYLCVTEIFKTNISP